jgi:hypothetical protein
MDSACLKQWDHEIYSVGSIGWETLFMLVSTKKDGST